MPTEIFDLITMGRSGVDIYPLQIGVGLEDVTTLGKGLGASVTNVAVAAAPHGLRLSFATRDTAEVDAFEEAGRVRG